MNDQAKLLAKRIREQHPENLAHQVRLAIRLTTGRTPPQKEIKQDLEFISALVEKEKLTEEMRQQRKI